MDITFNWLIYDDCSWNTGILCAIGGIIGGFIGAKLLNKIPDKYLKLAFAIFLIYAGWNMLF